MVQILRTTDDHSFELDEEALGRILLADDVKDKPVVVVSVAGAFRKGKSLLLDFFLRYMHSEGESSWMDDPSVRLGGSSWREACERNSTGILLWNEAFLVTRSDGQRLAVLFMYTHGAFDSTSTAADCSKLLALSIMTSSVQVYNLSQAIKESDLQHLQLLSECGRLVEKDRTKQPFQELLFLVRDWSNLHDAGYGAEGGTCFLDRTLQMLEEQNQEQEQLRRILRSCFTKIRCFLMAHPGDRVAATPSFDGPLSDIEDAFKKQLEELVPSLLAPDNLLVKKINGREISCQELMTYFKMYVNTVKEHKLLDPEAIREVVNDFLREVA
ncbi:hypothetical protein HPB48_014080 [Haemaphysalis longicornis]|uniref:GB1/RHD3-type G domain-containing protein n=1 Tax=Haemaphysalis longicornis TaxID=44386 RepID=A0A9J6H199_HAELO|nr:hypothetical protein HPB48_014080 [Haemaphysalis longicornis]